MAEWLRPGMALLLLLIIASGCTSPSSDTYYFKDVNGSDSNGQVKVSSNDSTFGYLNGKLVAGSNITLTENNNGGNETLTIASTTSGIGTDTNCSTSPDCNNLYVKLNPITAQTIGNAPLIVDKNLRVNGVISGGDFNQSIIDHNDSFSCPGQAIQTIGNTTACVAVGSGSGDINWQQLNPIIPWQDVNVADNLTINTDKNIITDTNIHAHGYIIADRNITGDGIVSNNFYNNASGLMTISAPNFIVLNSPLLGFSPTRTEIGTIGFEFGNSRSTGTHTTTNVFALNLAGGNPWPFVVSGLGQTGMQFNNTNEQLEINVLGLDTISFGVFTKEGSAWIKPVNNCSTIDVNKNGGVICAQRFSDGNSLMMQNNSDSNFFNIGGWQSDFAPDYNLDRVRIREDLNVVDDVIIGDDLNVLDDVNIAGDFNAYGNSRFRRNVYLDLNTYLDGNLFARDGNSFIGDPDVSGIGNIRYTGYEFNCRTYPFGACLNILANTCAFLSTGNGICFNATNRVIDHRLSDGTMIAGIGITGTADGAYYNIPKTTQPSFNVIGPIPGMKWDLNDMSYIIPQSYQSKFGESRDIGQVQNGGFAGACAGMNTMVAGTVTVTTTCMRDLNSLVFLTRQSAGSNVGGVSVGVKTFGTSFTIVSSNILDDVNVAWHIIQLS